MSRFGVPYMGSKNFIAEWVVDKIPTGETLVDLFAGGCAITHAAILSGKWKNFIANDITDAPGLFLDAINGKYKDESHFVTREEFFQRYKTDPYIRYCWSFGNEGTQYLYGRDIERLRQLQWEMCFALTPYERKVKMRAVFLEVFNMGLLLCNSGDKSDKGHQVLADRLEALFYPGDYEKDYKKVCGEIREYLIQALKDSGLTQSQVQKHLGTQMAGHYFGASEWTLPTKENYEKLMEILPLKEKWEVLNDKLQKVATQMRYKKGLQATGGLGRLQSLEQLQSLERLGTIQRLEGLQTRGALTIMQKDYRAVPIPRDAVIYCDIPYRGAHGYNGDNDKKDISTFDHASFYDWAEKQDNPIIISEYDMPRDRFFMIAEKKKRENLSYALPKGNYKMERLFSPIKQKEKIEGMLGFLIGGDE